MPARLLERKAALVSETDARLRRLVGRFAAAADGGRSSAELERSEATEVGT